MRFFLIVVLVCPWVLAGCATPSQEMRSITPEGIQARTGFTIQNEEHLEGTKFPPGTDIARPLTSGDAAAIALWNNAQLRADLASIGVAQADLLDAGLIRNPRLDVLFPVGLKPFELLLNLPIESLWERPARVEAATKAYEQISHSLVQNGLNAVQDARIAHANLVLAMRREEVLKQAAELRGRISRINNTQRLRTGELTQVEGYATKVESASADEQWVRAKHDTQLAMVRFKLVLGLVFESKKLEVKAVSPSTAAPASIETLVEQAMTKRPDLRAAELAIAAAAKRAGWESTRLTQLSAQLSVKRIGPANLAGPGVSAEIPIFNQNNGRRARADAEVEVASRQYLALRQKVASEVAEARELLLQAQEGLSRIREQQLPLLEKSVNIAEREYKRGTAAYLFVLEQTRSLVDAQIREAEAEAAVARAEAVLKRGVGAG